MYLVNDAVVKTQFFFGIKLGQLSIHALQVNVESKFNVAVISH